MSRDFKDKRTVQGKKYDSLSNEEKIIFLLEQIISQNNDRHIPQLVTTNNLLRYIAKRLIEIQEITNSGKHWKDDYIKSEKRGLE